MSINQKPRSADSKRLSVSGRRKLGFVDANNRRGLQANNAVDLNGNWKFHLSVDSRHEIVNKLMDTLQRHMPASDSEGTAELRKIALRFEEKIYAAATNQQDYLRKISLKMLTLETKAHSSATNSLPSNILPGCSQKNLDPGTCCIGG